MNVIEASQLIKKYNGQIALNQFSINVPEGTITALLGPNGSGKTTFLKCLLGLIPFDQGELKISGINASSANSRKDVAYLPEKFAFFLFETVYGTLQFFCEMRGIEKKSQKDIIAQAVSKLGISEIIDKKLKNISKGQLQRVGLASLLIGNPTTLLLDEPHSGLDPMAIKEMKDLLLELKAQGKTIFINSHLLNEMEQIADYIAILNKGELLVQGEIKSVLKGQRLENLFYDLIKGN